MYYDPYDEEVQVKFHRTDPTGRIIPLDTGENDEYEEFSGNVLRAASIFVACMLAFIAWWLA